MTSLLSPAMCSTLPYTDLVEPMIDGTTNYIYLQITKIFLSVINWFLKSFDASSSKFYALLGDGASNYSAPLFNVFLWTGALLTLFLFLYHAFLTTMGPMVDQKNNIIELVVRFFITCALVGIARPLCGILNDYICNASFNSEGAKSLAARFSEEFSQSLNTAIGQSSNVADFLGSSMDMLGDLMTSSCLIQIIALIAVGIGFVKLLLKIIERYVLSQLLIIASPVAFATWASRTTSNILQNFIRMYITTLFTVLFCRVYLYMVCAMISNGAWMHLGDALILLAFMKQVENLEAQLRAMGLSVAQTGGSLLYSIGAGAMGLGMLLKKGGGFAGNVLERAGGAKGNIGMASLGTHLKSLSHGQMPTRAQTIRAFGEQEGFANVGHSSSSQYAHMVDRVADLAKSGQVMNLKNVPTNIQTDAIKQMMTENGYDAFAYATGGLRADEITSAHFNFDGSVTGMAEHDGKVINFKAGTEVDPNAKQYGIVDNFGGSKRYISTTAAGGYEGTIQCDFSKMEPGQQSIVSTLTNFPVDNQKFADANITSVGISDGIMHCYDSGNNLKFATNMSDPGRSYTVGSIDLPASSQSEIFASGSPYNSISGMLPPGAVPGGKGVIDTDRGERRFDYTSAYGTGTVVLSRPTDRDISSSSRANLVNMGDYGTMKVDVIPQKQGDYIDDRTARKKKF